MSLQSKSEHPAPIRATWFLISLVVVVHAVSAARDDHPLAALIGPREPTTRVASGGQEYALVAAGEFWRLFTSILLHVDLLHMAVNALALWILGTLLEPMIGGLRWLGLFILGGVSGSIVSQFAGVPLNDGASGGAYALLGATLIVAWRNREHLHKEDRRLMGPILAAMLALNLLLSVVLSFIDATGHIGGLCAGLAVAAAMPIHQPLLTREKLLWSALALGFFGVALGGWALG